MLRDVKAFSGFAADDVARAKGFYGTTLGLEVADHDAPGLRRWSGDDAVVAPVSGDSRPRNSLPTSGASPAR